jgi:hypothetical protein
MNPDRPPLPWEMIALYAAITLALLAALASRKTLSAAAREIPRATWIALLAVAATHAAVALLWIPGGPIEPNNHGYDRYTTIRDATLFSAYEGEQVHGGGWFALIRPVYLLFGGAVEPTTLNVGLAALGILALGAAVRLALRDDLAAVFAAASLALLPDELRSSHSVSMFIASQAGITAGWLAIELHLRDRSAATLLLAATATVLSMQTHLEMQAITPLLVGAWLFARAPRWYLEPTLAKLAVILAAGLLLTPHLLRLAEFPFDQVFVSIGHAERKAVAQRAIGSALLVFAATAIVRRTWAPQVEELTSSRRADLAGILAFGLALTLVAPGAWTLLTSPYEGANVLHGASPIGSCVHAIFDLNHTSPLVPLAAAAGMLALLARAQGFAWMLAAVGAATALVYGGRWDSWSTEVRGAVTLATVIAVPAGAGLAALHRALTRQAGSATATALVGVTLLVGLAPYLPMLGYDWSFLQEHRLLQAAHALAVDGARVHVLSPDDTVRIPDPKRFGLNYYRHYAGFMIGRFEHPVPGLEALLADPDPVGAYAVLPLSCYRALVAEDQINNRHVDLIWLDSRVYAVPAGRIALTGADIQDPASNQTAHMMVPCWADRALSTCIDADPAAPEGCRTWTCTATHPPPDHGLQDATCAAVRAAFELEPVVEAHANPGAYGTTLTDLIEPDPVIGLYRVTGRR